MATATAPWSGEALASSVDAYGLTIEIDAYVTGSTTPYPLSIISASCDYDAARSPRVHASTTIAWPADSVRAMLDPRFGLKIDVQAGYQFFGTGREDTQRMALLRVQEVVTDQAAKTITITADSDEIIAIGYPIETAVSYAVTDTVVGAIQAVIAAAFVGETLTWVIGGNVRKTETFADTQVLTPGQDRWGFVADWADSIGAVVYHDGLGVWHIDNADPVASASTVANLTTGERGTIVNVTTTESLNGYANRAAAVYEYAIGTATYRQTAIAGTTLTPRKMATAVATFKPHNATEVAKSMLRRALRRGHTVVVEAATWLWIRPGFTVTANLPDGTQERLLVETAAFDLTAGTMTVSGQNAEGQPLNAITTSVTTTTL